MKILLKIKIVIVLLFANNLWAKDIITNALVVKNPPKWLKSIDVRKASSKIERELEWSIRRTEVIWYHDSTNFIKAHGFGENVRAVTQVSQKNQRIILGPKVHSSNFSEVLGHELVHLVFYQKYRGSIPKWLEEGFANHIARKNIKVDYKWLKSKKTPEDIRSIVHLYNKDNESEKYHYMSSLALVRMIDKKCDLENLIRLSVERKMEDYIKTFCEIPDINSAYKSWLEKKSS